MLPVARPRIADVDACFLRVACGQFNRDAERIGTQCFRKAGCVFFYLKISTAGVRSGANFFKGVPPNLLARAQGSGGVG